LRTDMLRGSSYAHDDMAECPVCGSHALTRAVDDGSPERGSCLTCGAKWQENDAGEAAEVVPGPNDFVDKSS